MPEVFTQNDYINAGRLQHKISHLRKLIESQRMSNERLCYRLEALNMVESIIDAQPKADVKRVRHGYWKPVMMSEATGWDLSLTGGRDEVCEHVCSVCGKAAFIDETGDEVLSCLCLQCGADMRENGGADNDT